MRPEDTTRATRRLGHLVAVLSAAAILALGCWSGALEAWHIEFDPVNGHFQNFNAEARLLAGQLPFVDFPAYLGLAPLLLPFPLFAALGGTLAASNAAYDVVCVVLLGASFVIAMRLCRWPAAIAWAWAVPLTAVPWPMARGNESAIGIRSFLPFAAAAALLALGRWRLRGGHPAAVLAVAGAAAGIMPLWSNDYGVPSAAAFCVAAMVSLDPGTGAGARLRGWGAFFGSAACCCILALVIVTGGHPLVWAQFNFGGVLADQFWYFNPVAAGKVYGPADIPHGLPEALLVVPNAAVWLWWLLRRRRDPAAAALALLCGAATGGAFLSGLAGTFEPRYFMPLWRLTLVTLPFAVALAWRAAAARIAPSRCAGPSRLMVRMRRDAPLQFILAAAAVGVGCWLVSLDAADYWKHPEGDDVAVAELGGRIRPSYLPTVEEGRRLRAEYDAAGVPPDRRLFSTYATATALAAGSRQSGPDYIIHALGDAGRARFADALDMDYRNVETMDPDLMLWGLWNVRTSWPFFHRLFTGWHPVSRTPWSLVWERGAAPSVSGAAVPCRVSGPGADGFWSLSIGTDSAAPPSGPWWVEVEADISTGFRPLPFPIAGSHRLLEVVESRDPAGHVTGPDAGMGEIASLVSNTWTLRLADGVVAMPMRWRADAAATLSLRAWPRDRTTLEVRSCRARMVVPVAATLLPWSGPRGGTVAIAAGGVPPRPEPYPARHGTEAYALKTSDPAATMALRAGDGVVFPGGERSVILLRDFHQVLVERLPGMNLDYVVESIRVVPHS